MKKYGWQQKSQWDTPGLEFYVKYERIKTGISEDICSWILVENIDIGNNVTRREPILKTDVTPEMLEIANSV